MARRHGHRHALRERDATAKCVKCGRTTPVSTMIPVSVVPTDVLAAAELKEPIAPDAMMCRTCLAHARAIDFRRRLEKERGALGAIELDVAKHAAESSLIATDVDREFARNETFAQKLADRVARVGGSWRFVIGFGLFLATWMAINTVLLARHAFDPYPYILLNLVLSCLAAIQAPLILMSQNRAAERDRARAEQDFRVNLKAELEVTALHEKMDLLIQDKWETLVELQEAQTDLLEDALARIESLENRAKGGGGGSGGGHAS